MKSSFLEHNLSLVPSSQAMGPVTPGRSLGVQGCSLGPARGAEPRCGGGRTGSLPSSLPSAGAGISVCAWVCARVHKYTGVCFMGPLSCFLVRFSVSLCQSTIVRRIKDKPDSQLSAWPVSSRPRAPLFRLSMQSLPGESEQKREGEAGQVGGQAVANRRSGEVAWEVRALRPPPPASQCL